MPPLFPLFTGCIAAKAWAAPGAWPRPVSIADKTLADVMESLIGAFFLAANDLAASLHFMNWAGIMVPANPHGASDRGIKETINPV